ncbi:MAG: GNAT family N-acetyltransferase [Phycisphaerae bacterium]|nr:GNAT family N-acetyltransferase [Phycisphaerae bacterium]
MALRDKPLVAPGEVTSVRRCTSHDEAAWDAALDASGTNNPFLTSRFLRRLQTTLDRPIVRIACFERDRLVAGLAGVDFAPDGPRCLERLPLVPHTGVFVVAGTERLLQRRVRREHRILSALATYVADEFDRADIDAVPECADIRPFLWADWSSSIRYTLRSDLRIARPDDFDPDVRRRIRRATESGVHLAQDVASDEFAALWAETLRRTHARPPIPPAALGVLIEQLRAEPTTHIHAARLPDGRLAAINVVLQCGETAWYWLAASDTSASTSGAVQLAMACALERLAQHCSTLDWVGANLPRIAHAKQAFGPSLVPYVRLSWSRRRDSDRGPMRRWMRWIPWRFSRRSSDR